MRKILLILASLCVVNSALFSAETTTSDSNQFVAGSYITNSAGFNCRELKNKNDYETQIIGYDFMNGIIKCAIIPKKNGIMEIPRTENANSLSTQETFEAYYNNPKNKKNFYERLKQVAQDAKDTIMGETVKLEVEVKKGSTLSSYLSGLAVLNGMDAKNTAGMSYTETKIGNIFEGNDITTSQGTTNVANNLNKSNIEYFENLFTNMNTVYIHLQNLLFVVVGGFFLATLGGAKVQKYLENRGQSTGNKEPYLHKFFIPLLCAGVFYMPITSGGGVNSTMIQKIIQYFTAEANHIADVASSIGSSTYVQKMIADIGLKGFVAEDNKLLGELDELKAEFIITKAKTELKKCTDYYNTQDDFNFAQYDALKWEEFAAKEQLQGGKNEKNGFFVGMWKSFTDLFSKEPQNISLQACTQISQEIQNAQKTQEKIKQAREELEKQGKDSESVKVKERAKKNHIEHPKYDKNKRRTLRLAEFFNRPCLCAYARSTRWLQSGYGTKS